MIRWGAWCEQCAHRMPGFTVILSKQAPPIHPGELTPPIHPGKLEGFFVRAHSVYVSPHPPYPACCCLPLGSFCFMLSHLLAEQDLGERDARFQRLRVACTLANPVHGAFACSATNLWGFLRVLSGPPASSLRHRRDFTRTRVYVEGSFFCPGLQSALSLCTVTP